MKVKGEGVLNLGVDLTYDYECSCGETHKVSNTMSEVRYGQRVGVQKACENGVITQVQIDVPKSEASQQIDEILAGGFEE